MPLNLYALNLLNYAWLGFKYMEHWNTSYVGMLLYPHSQRTVLGKGTHTDYVIADEAQTAWPCPRGAAQWGKLENICCGLRFIHHIQYIFLQLDCFTAASKPKLEIDCAELPNLFGHIMQIWYVNITLELSFVFDSQKRVTCFWDSV